MHSYKEIDSKYRNNTIIIKSPRRLILEIISVAFLIEPILKLLPSEKKLTRMSVNDRVQADLILKIVIDGL